MAANMGIKPYCSNYSEIPGYNYPLKNLRQQPGIMT